MIVVTAGVIGGFVMEGGHLMVLFQPAEFVIIGGAAMGEAGLSPGHVREVRGYAANRPRFPENPGDPRNRRISILVLNDFAETIRRPLTVGGQTFVYEEGVGYRESGRPGGASTGTP